MQKNIRVSVIVPVYNVENYLEKCVNSLLNQTIGRESLQIILIDDGSTDSSPAICDRLSAENTCVTAIHQENAGVSAARNRGIQEADGKYIVYLDSDDTLLKNTIAGIVEVFEQHYDEIDIVTYPEIHLAADGKKLPQHFRYEYLGSTGVYDLTLDKNIYISLTNMNICVKNLFDKNVLFPTDMKYGHEDQKYCCDILRDKMKLGFSNQGGYVYLQRSASIVHSSFYAYYIFEDTMHFWEELFGGFDGRVPRYFQALYINDVSWKTICGKLLPYHYEREAFNEAVGRIVALLKRVDNEVVCSHPRIDAYTAQYLIRLKGDKISVAGGIDSLVGVNANGELTACGEVKVLLTKFKIIGEALQVSGCVRAPLLIHTELPLKVVLDINQSDAFSRELALYPYSWDCMKSQTGISLSGEFSFSLPIAEVHSLSFRVYFNGKKIRNSLEFTRMSPFNAELKRETVYINGYRAALVRNSQINLTHISNKKVYQKGCRSLYRQCGVNSVNALITRVKADRYRDSGRRVWLYCDGRDIGKNNAYYQFLHDIDKEDSVERYYISDNEMFVADRRIKKHTVLFGSKKHIQLLFVCEKLLTASVAERSVLPFAHSTLPHIADLLNFEVVWLGKGVMFEHHPAAYSYHRSLADRAVVSTTLEREHFIKEYRFPADKLIACGAPHYDLLKKDAKLTDRILYAPEWRKYLVSENENGKISPEKARFLHAEFFKRTDAFLNDERLIHALEEKNLWMDFALPKAFSSYKALYQFRSARIRMTDEEPSTANYAALVTDYSSRAFTFAYLKKAVIFFVPDYDMVRSGSCDFHSFIMPQEDGFGEFVTDSTAAVDAVIRLIENDFAVEPKYAEKADGMFVTINDCREKIYQELIGE